MVKNPLASTDGGSIPRLGRFPGGRSGNPLQYSCLENSMVRRTWWATVHVVRKESNTAELLQREWAYRLNRQMDLIVPWQVGSPGIRDWTHVSCIIGRQILYHWATREALGVQEFWILQIHTHTHTHTHTQYSWDLILHMGRGKHICSVTYSRSFILLFTCSYWS